MPPFLFPHPFITFSPPPLLSFTFSTRLSLLSSPWLQKLIFPLALGDWGKERYGKGLMKSVDAIDLYVALDR